MLRTALGGQADGGGDDDTQFLLRTVLLLTSPMAWLRWKDYLGLDPADAAATAGWAIKALTHARRVKSEGEPSWHPGGHEQINLIRTSLTTAARRRDLRQNGGSSSVSAAGVDEGTWPIRHSQ
jgi:hypothetical protein